MPIPMTSSGPSHSAPFSPSTPSSSPSPFSLAPSPSSTDPSHAIATPPVSSAALTFDPAAVLGAAQRLRGLSASAPPLPAVPVAAPDTPAAAISPVAAIAPVPAVARFLESAASATAVQSGRVSELLTYAHAAASALDWMAGAVGVAEGDAAAGLAGHADDVAATGDGWVRA